MKKRFSGLLMWAGLAVLIGILGYLLWTWSSRVESMTTDICMKEGGINKANPDPTQVRMCMKYWANVSGVAATTTRNEIATNEKVNNGNKRKITYTDAKSMILDPSRGPEGEGFLSMSDGTVLKNAKDYVVLQNADYTDQNKVQGTEGAVRIAFVPEGYGGQTWARGFYDFFYHPGTENVLGTISNDPKDVTVETVVPVETGQVSNVEYIPDTLGWVAAHNSIRGTSLNPLAWSSELANMARKNVQWEKEHKKPMHSAFYERIHTGGQDDPSVVENWFGGFLVADAQTALGVVSGWNASGGHRVHMVDPGVTQVGCYSEDVPIHMLAETQPYAGITICMYRYT